MSPIPMAFIATVIVLTMTARSSGTEGRQKNVVPNEITFAVTVENNRGQLACALFRKSGWLDDAVQSSFARIENKRARCVFRNIAPGTYAISAFHDENANRRLDTNFLGIPTEDWCTSRDASGFMGPPRFNDAKFRYRGGRAELRGDTR